MNDNKRIAEFMGFHRTEKGYIVGGFGDGTFGLAKELLFHSSWDWLMPVMRKIEDGGSDPHELINKALESRSIEVVYNEVVDAIERYNNEL